jgi:perosamine synthetase
MKVSFGSPVLTNIEKKYLNLALKSTWLSQGSYNLKLENLFKNIHKKKYCLTVCNGTLGIQLALMAFNLKSGDEVLIPEYSYISPAHICKLMGLKITIVKINNINLQIDFDDLQKKINHKTKCILLIHNYGNMGHIDKICALAKKNRVYILEDFSEAIFSKYKKKYVGSFGDISVASFHATKSITTGEGGGILTNSNFLYNKMLSMREHGFKNRGDYSYKMIGSNFKLSNLLASIGFAQLQRYKKTIVAKKKIYQNYISGLSKIKELRFPTIENKNDLCMWAFPIIVNDSKKYKNLINFLKYKKIPFRAGFNLLQSHSYLKIKKNNTNRPSVILLPMNANLKKTEVSLFVKIIGNFFENYLVLNKNLKSKRT